MITVLLHVMKYLSDFYFRNCTRYHMLIQSKIGVKGIP